MTSPQPDPHPESTDPMRPETELLENYFLLMDPEWEPEPGEEVPSIAAVIGFWPLAADGSLGAFRSNPDYRPRDENSVTDPLDALLRLAAQGEAEAGQLQIMMRDALFDTGLNGDGRPLIVKSPDDVPCVVVATSAVQRDRVYSPGWQRIDLAALVSLLPDGIDVLFNPGGPVPFRLTGDFIRETLLMSDEELAAAYETFRAKQPDQSIEVIPWVVGDENAEITVETAPAKPRG